MGYELYPGLSSDALNIPAVPEITPVTIDPAAEMQRLRPFVGDSFRVANFLSERKSFVKLGAVAKRCSPISTSFSIHDTLTWLYRRTSHRITTPNFYPGIIDAVILPGYY